MRKTGEYVGRALSLLALLVMVNLVLLLMPSLGGIVLESWVDVLWAVNFSLVLQIVGSSVLLFYRRAWLEGLLRAMFPASGLLALVVFFVIFPLDFSRAVGPWLNTAVRVALLLGMAASVRKIWGAGESNP